VRNTSEIRKKYRISHGILFNITCYLFIILTSFAPILFGYDTSMAYIFIPITISIISIFFLSSISNTNFLFSKMEKIFLLLALFFISLLIAIYGTHFFPLTLEPLSSLKNENLWSQTRDLVGGTENYYSSYFPENNRDSFFIMISYTMVFYIIYQYTANELFPSKILKSISISSIFYVFLITIFSEDLFVFDLFKQNSSLNLYIALAGISSLTLLILSLQKNISRNREFYTETEVKIKKIFSFGYLYFLAFIFFTMKIILSSDTGLLCIYIISLSPFFLITFLTKKEKRLKAELRKLLFLTIIFSSAVYLFVSNLSRTNDAYMPHYHFENLLSISKSQEDSYEIRASSSASNINYHALKFMNNESILGTDVISFIKKHNNIVKSYNEVPFFSIILIETGYLGLLIAFSLYALLLIIYIYGVSKKKHTNAFLSLGVSCFLIVSYNIFTNNSASNPVLATYIIIITAISFKESFSVSKKSSTKSEDKK